MALTNPARIRSRSIEATQFQQWADQHHVYGVPKTIIRIDGQSAAVAIEGAFGEELLIKTIKTAIKAVSS